MSKFILKEVEIKGAFNVFWEFANVRYFQTWEVGYSEFRFSMQFLIVINTDKIKMKYRREFKITFRVV